MFYFQSFGLESIGQSVGWQIVLKDGAQSSHFVYICGPTLGLFFLEPKVKVRSFFHDPSIGVNVVGTRPRENLFSFVDKRAEFPLRAAQCPLNIIVAV